MIDLIRKGFFDKGEKVRFTHTGSSPALHVHADCFLEK
jgi:hypothetical protein